MSPTFFHSRQNLIFFNYIYSLIASSIILYSKIKLIKSASLKEVLIKIKNRKQKVIEMPKNQV